MTSLVLAAALVLQAPSPTSRADAAATLQHRREIRARRRRHNNPPPAIRSPFQPTQIRQPAHLKEAGQWLIENRDLLRRIQGH